jgi:hypothetical protein
MRRAPISWLDSVSIVGRNINYCNKNGLFTRHTQEAWRGFRTMAQRTSRFGRINSVHTRRRRGDQRGEGWGSVSGSD